MRNYLKLFAACIVAAIAIPTVRAQTIQLFPASGDDWPQIQSALNLAQSGDTVMLETGNYDISQRLILKKSGVTLRGRYGQTTIEPSTSFPAYADDENCLLCIWNSANPGSVTGIEITNLVLDGASNDNAIAGILTKLGGHHIFHHLIIRNIAPQSGLSAGIALSASRYVNIDNNTIENIGRNGISVAADSDHATVSYNTIRAIGDFFADNPLSDSFNYTNTGFAIEFTRTEDNGVPIEGSDFGIIENNSITGFISIGGSSYIALRNNRIIADSSHTRYAGIEIAGSSPDFPGKSNIVISGNTVRGPAGPGGAISGITFTADGSNINYGLIHHNAFSRTETAGINLEGMNLFIVSRLLFLNNRTENNKEGFLGFEGDGEGMTLTGNVYNIIFHSNVFRNNDRTGIKLSTHTNRCPNKLEFTFNRITNNGEDSIAGCNIVGNTFETFSSVSPPNLAWESNTVSDNNPDIQLSSIGFDVNQAPAISLSEIGRSGNTVTFRATISDDHQPNFKLLWDFGEGLPMSQSIDGNEVSYTYTFRSPQYAVTLAAWDLEGRAGFASLVSTSSGNQVNLAPNYLLLLN